MAVWLGKKKMGEVGLENKESEQTNIFQHHSGEKSNSRDSTSKATASSIFAPDTTFIGSALCFQISLPPKSWQFFFQRKFEVEKRDYSKEFGGEIPELVNKNLKV